MFKCPVCILGGQIWRRQKSLSRRHSWLYEIHWVWYESMVKATEKISVVSKNTVTPLLDKARGELPPPPAKKAAAPVKEVKPASRE